MSEGRQYLVNTLEICQRVLDQIKPSPETEKFLNQIKEAGDKLEDLKDKIYLKTKKGINDAYLILEAAKSLETKIDECKSLSAEKSKELLEELETDVDAFASDVETLEGSAKSRTVVIT
jgi:hypothetical protein